VNVYDYVVIGAGSAGCAVAARLAAASYTVLLIEAGGSDRRISVRTPLAYGGQVGGPTDWAFESEPEPGCDGRRIPQPRGKVLGGTSAMNAMVWVCAAAGSITTAGSCPDGLGTTSSPCSAESNRDRCG
jgi:choline dehydrogenase